MAMGTKTTRSNAEVKAIVADICNNKDFLQSIFDYVEKCNSKIKQQQQDPMLEAVNVNKNVIAELKEENEILRKTIEDLKTELLSLKEQTSQSRQGKNQGERNIPQDGKKLVGKHASKLRSEPRIDETPKADIDNAKDTMPSTSIPVYSEDQMPANNNPAGKDAFVEPRRKKRTSTKTVGTAKVDRSGGVLLGSAHPKTAWFYVGKISNKNAKEDDVRKYITDEEGDIDILVEKLSTQGPYAAFKIKVPFGLLEKLREPGYWPAGVVVRRFNFWDQSKNKQKVNNIFLDRNNQ